MFDLVEECKKLISLRSDGGTREVVGHLVPLCKAVGFEVTLQSAGNGLGQDEINLIAHTVPADFPDLCHNGLLLTTHLDTVPPGDLSLWTKSSPFCPLIEGDRIYGLGSADTKLDFLCKLKAIEDLSREAGRSPADLRRLFRLPIALAGTFGEERALAGARLIRESGILHPRFALVGEPSEMKPVIGHKGILYMQAALTHNQMTEGQKGEGRVVRGKVSGGGSARRQNLSEVTGPDPDSAKMIFRGRAAHGAMPHLGENAIEKAVQWLLKEFEKEPSLQLTGISGGTVHNVVPDRCEVFLAKGTAPDPRLSFLKAFFRRVETARTLLKGQTNEAFDPPETTLNIGVIRGDPQRIEIEFDFRLLPETDGNGLFELFRTVSLEAPGSEVTMIRSNPPMNTHRDSEIVKKVGESLRRIGLPAEFIVKSGNTEGAVFCAMGIETIVIGPGRSAGNIHAPNEFNEIPQLSKAVEFYAAFLRQFIQP